MSRGGAKRRFHEFVFGICFRFSTLQHQVEIAKIQGRKLLQSETELLQSRVFPKGVISPLLREIVEVMQRKIGDEVVATHLKWVFPPFYTQSRANICLRKSSFAHEGLLRET